MEQHPLEVRDALRRTARPPSGPAAEDLRAFRAAQEAAEIVSISAPLEALDICPVCGLPGHTSETDDAGRHPGCMYAEGSIPVYPCGDCGEPVLATEGQRVEPESHAEADDFSGMVCRTCADERVEVAA